MNGLVEDKFWIVAEHGHHAQYVKNLEANPRVRIRIGRRWLKGVANVLPGDDPWERARWLTQATGRHMDMDARLNKLFGTSLLTVRVDLEGELR